MCKTPSIYSVLPGWKLLSCDFWTDQRLERPNTACHATCYSEWSTVHIPVLSGNPVQQHEKHSYCSRVTRVSPTRFRGPLLSFMLQRIFLPIRITNAVKWLPRHSEPSPGIESRPQAQVVGHLVFFYYFLIGTVHTHSTSRKLPKPQLQALIQECGVWHSSVLLSFDIA